MILKKFTSFVLVLALILGLSTTAFADTPTTYYVSIEQVTEEANNLKRLGLFCGTNNGFELERTPTRLEGLVMLIRLMGEDEDAQKCNEVHPFEDVPTWGNGYVAWAYSKGYTTGTSKTQFSPDNNMKANEYFAFILRALGYGKDFIWPYSIEKARDLEIIPSTAYSNVNAPFLRTDVVHISYLAMSTKIKGSDECLYEDLSQRSVINSETAHAIFNKENNTERSFEEVEHISIDDMLKMLGVVFGKSLNSSHELTSNEMQTATDIVAEIITPSMSQYQKILTLHDYVANAAKYGYPNENAEAAYTASGVFIYSTAVCNGYARAFEALMKAAGLEVMLISSSEMRHAWNLVKLNDRWYHVDVTWDDDDVTPDISVRYDWFLMPDNIMEKDHYWNHQEYPAATDARYVPEWMFEPTLEEKTANAISSTASTAITVNNDAELIEAIKNSISVKSAEFAIICLHGAPPESDLGGFFFQAAESAFDGAIAFRHTINGNTVIYYEINYTDRQPNTWTPGPDDELEIYFDLSDFDTMN